MKNAPFKSPDLHSSYSPPPRHQKKKKKKGKTHNIGNSLKSLLQPSPVSASHLHYHHTHPFGSGTPGSGDKTYTYWRCLLRKQNWNIKKLSKNISWNFCVWYVKNVYSFDAMLKLGLDVSLIPAISNSGASLDSIGDYSVCADMTQWWVMAKAPWRRKKAWAQLPLVPTSR